MIISCEKCNARYDLDVSGIKKPSFKVRCAQCNHGFKVHIEQKKKIVVPQEVPPPEGKTAHIVAISNQKGGVAKTSTCINLGLALSAEGKKVLIVDFDVQTNLTTSMNLSPTLPSFFDLLQSGNHEIANYIHKTDYQDVSLLPSNSKMALLAKHFMHTPNFEFMLRDRLKYISPSFDYILIDTPPAIGFCTLNALMASNHVIIPTPCEYLSMQGIHKIEEIIQIVGRRTQQNIDYNILITMHDKRSISAKVIFKKIQNMFQNRVFRTIIDLDEKMKESLILHQPVHSYAPESNSAKQYTNLAREFIELTSP